MDKPTRAAKLHGLLTIKPLHYATRKYFDGYIDDNTSSMTAMALTLKNDLHHLYIP